MYGLTDDGFEIKRLPIIKSELEDSLRAAFPGATITPDSVIGQIVGIMSNPLADIWEIVELVYLAFYPASAEGFSLDGVAQISGIVRLDATNSEVLAILEGTEGTTVPDGTQVSVLETGEIYNQVGAIAITKISVLKAVISVDTVFNTYPYDVTIDSVVYTFTSDADATAEEIAAGLTSEINGSQSKVTAVDNLDGTFYIQVDDLITPFSVDPDVVVMSLSEIWSKATYNAINTGAVLANAGTLTVIETPVAGLNSVDNLTDADLGRDLETDPELRMRRLQSLAISGAGTLEAIKAKILQEVDSVLAVTAFENRTDIIDGFGRPPHSFEIVVTGGTNQDIGDKIWTTKPAGIQTFGNVAVNVNDSQGDIQVINFSRATGKFAWIDIKITLNPEENFPVDGLTLIRTSLLTFCEDTFSVGDDFILQKLYTPVYQIQGIGTATITIGITATAAPITGTTDGTTTNKLIDSGATFLSTVNAGMKANNTTDVTDATIVSVDSDTQLTLDADIFTTGENYSLEKNLVGANILIGEVATLIFDSSRITDSII